MTQSMTKKRLDQIEIYLTPKEWAIRLADAIRKYPSQDEFTKAELKTPYTESPFRRPYGLLQQQAEVQALGNERRSVEAIRQLTKRLQSEFCTLKTIILEVNTFLLLDAETLRLKAVLKLAELHALLLQESFGWMARRVASWVERCKNSGAGREELQSIVKELEAYTNVSFALDSLSSLIEDWVQDIVGLIVEVSSRQAAIQLIQNKYFEGHPILYRDLEDGLEATMKALENGLNTFNEYLKALESRGTADGYAQQGICQGPLAIDLAAIKNGVEERMAAERADRWIAYSKQKATAGILKASAGHEAYVEHEWSRLREIFGVEV